MFYAPQIMLILFKHPEYLVGVPVFRTFQVFLLVAILSNLYGMGALVTHRRDHSYRKALAISVVMMLILCPIFTFRWGPEGAAVAVLLGQASSLVLFMMETRDIVHADHLRILGSSALIGTIPVVFGTVFHLGFWVSVVALVLTYLAIVIWRQPALFPVKK